jgi:DNA (cytosine-5)-methyltransferase 1
MRPSTRVFGDPADATSSSEESITRPRKRRRVAAQGESAANRSSVSNTPVDTDTEATSLSEQPSNDYSNSKSRRRTHHRGLSHICAPGPVYARSRYQGYEPPFPPIAEWDAAAEIWKARESRNLDGADASEYVYFSLDEFSIYWPSTGTTKGEARTGELATLDLLNNRDGCSTLLFDGILSYAGERRYVQGIPFSILTIDGYGEEDVVDLHGKICIQSCEAAEYYTDIWYQLGNPSPEYQRFYKPFLWLAQFTKYFVDFLLERDTEDTSLAYFQSCFPDWLRSKYGTHRAFQNWREIGPRSSDFRTTVAANIGFLWKESYSLSLIGGSSQLRKHSLWGQVDWSRLSAIPSHPNVKKNTVVTPYAYACFQSMYFADRLERMPITDARTRKAVAHRKLKMGFTPAGTAFTTRPVATEHPEPTDTLEINAGDVLTVLPEEAGKWTSTANTWYAYVQDVRIDKGQCQVLDVLWLYEPSDTTLGAAPYPFANELFLSDNCSCGKDAIDRACITGKVQVAWFTKDPGAARGFFVRQKFRTVHEDDTYDFVTLKESDFSCGCGKHTSLFEECVQKYELNDVVLVRQWHEELADELLEPAQIVEFDTAVRRVIVRRLARKELVSDARPNELLLTQEVGSVGPSKIIRECTVRVFKEQDIREGRLPTPFDREGAGDFFYFSDAQAISSQPFPSSGRDIVWKSTDGAIPLPAESHSDDVPLKKMRGMGLFCGGGNMDRGLEDGGAVEFRYAIDWAEKALHSYRANQASTDAVKYWLGSINDYHSKALEGSRSTVIAKPGDVEVISAGSPCPGFSIMQQNKLSDESRTNASMVASVVSFVDFYSPQYLILENVVAMTWNGGPNKDENVFCQVLAALVAMGYQVQQFLMDAWSFGSPQQRSRVFIVASAPGLEPFQPPPHTHRHLEDLPLSRCLGRSANGLPFGIRRNDCTPFLHVSAQQSTKDLPDVADSAPRSCPAFPDHRVSASYGPTQRPRIHSVPILPHGMTLVKAYSAGRISSADVLKYVRSQIGKVRGNPRSKSYGRVFPDGLFLTIATALQIHDGNNGRCVHWNQHRSITVMEARRAQGFLDHEVIVGSPRDQVKIIGNSVDRKVSLALGLALKQSWLKSGPTSLAAQGGPSSSVSALPGPTPASFSNNNPAEPPRSINNSPSKASQTSSYDLEQEGWRDPTLETTPAPEDARGSAAMTPRNRGGLDPGTGAVVVEEPSTPESARWARHSQSGTLLLSDTQKAEIRADGFKAIARMMPELQSSPRSQTSQT